MKKIILLMVIVAPVAFAIIILSTSTTLFLDNVSENEPLKLSINPFPGTDYIFIAEKKGFFKQNGVDVELIVVPNYQENVESFTQGKVDGVFEVFADAIIQNTNGIDLKVVWIMDYSTNGDVLIGSVEDISDLEGKTIGTNGVQSFSHYFVVKTLEKNGINENDVNFENTGENKVITSIDDKLITAGHTWGPHKSEGLQKGYKIIGKAGDIPGVILDVLVFSTDVIQDRPGDVKAVIKTLVQARNYLDEHPEESIQIMSKFEQLSYDEMEIAVDDAYRPTLEDNKNILSKTHEISIHSLGDDIVNFYLERGAINRIPDMDEIVYSGFVLEIGEN